MLCLVITNRGTRCKLRVTNNGLCKRHQTMENNGIALNKVQNNINHANNVNNNNNARPRVAKKEIKEEPEIYEPLVLEKATDCVCCYTEYEPCDLVLCTRASMKNRHITCRECLANYLENTLNEKKSITCMMDNVDCCKGEYEDLDIIMSLDEKLLERYTQYKRIEEATKIAACLDNYHLCPFCSEYGIIIENPPGYQIIKNIKCMNTQCLRTWCIKCRKGYHGNEPCNKIDIANKELIKRIIDETIDEATIHKCPKCFTKYHKEDGCNLMTCPSCKAYSCYICNILIEKKNGLKYWHFRGSGSAEKSANCPLYNTSQAGEKAITKGNIEFNNKRIQESLNDLMDINKENQDVLNMIKEEIIERGFTKEKKKSVKAKSKSKSR